MKQPYVVVCLLWLGSVWAQAQSTTPVPLSKEEHSKQVLAHQAELNAEYRDAARSPLPPAVRGQFTGLPFFPIRYEACVLARFVRDSSQASFAMPTSTERKAMYRKYGELHFVLEGKPQHLTVYQSLDLLRRKEYQDYLFVPFTDLTNGRSSYGGGRYLDLRLGQIKDGQLVLDFNRAYNPFCAYSSAYSCPVPPPENRLPVAIEAGVMSDH
ncbi:DUF1684 domain-containing protein [Hymenobacter norwichensis]|uniref:DUF1684 domain-containing protein n=1 Tax=Hymenobacter norwichensis TaxID=223903 RepID=UPI000415DBA4|nr:DUF1684 domain-containing protein [Hymenobacter norwichensis]